MTNNDPIIDLKNTFLKNKFINQNFVGYPPLSPLKPTLLIILNRLVLGGQSIDTIPLAYKLKDEYNIVIVYGEKEKDEQECIELMGKSSGILFQKIPSLKRSINPLNELAAIFSLYKIIKKFNPVIVHTHGSKPGVNGRLAARFAKVPVIIHTFHGHLFHSYYNRFISSWIIQFEKFLSTLSTKIVVLGKQQQTEICKQYKIVNSEKVEVVPLGIDEMVYNKDAEALRKNFRNEYSLSDDCVAVGIIGRMVPVKNHKLLINIIKRLLNSDVKEKVKFFFIGDGYSKRELEKELIRANIIWSTDKNNRVAKVVFTSWITPITSALHALDIVALTSLNEGTPLSLIEAQICYKPVVASDVGGVKDTFIANETGFLIEDHNVVEFADKLLMLIQNKELRRTMGDRGNIFAKENFSKQAEVDAFRKLYSNCISHAKSKI
jgi:glycosyltransferase involved in cell wall biosynthesis